MTTLPPPPRNGAARTAPEAPAPSVLTRPLSAGEGVDRARPRRRVRGRALAVAAVALGVALLLGIAWHAARTDTLRLDAARVEVATVEEGPFQEYVAVTGLVTPIRTVFLDAVVGGQVARRLVDEGDTVAVGQPLFVLENDEMALQVMANEAQLEEQAASLRQNRLQLDRVAVEGEQARLAVERELAELAFEIDRLTRERDRTAGLVDRGAASQQDLDALAGELAYARRRHELAVEGRRLARSARAQEATQREAQLGDMAESVGRLRRNLSLVRGATADLVVRAPVAGQFSALAAEVGELKTRGERLGQIDVLDRVKLRASVDEHYLPRVAPDQPASVTVEGATYALRVRTVYPEVADGRFEVELVFAGPVPADLRRGQSARVRLELGAPETAVLLPAGRYVRQSKGAVFVLDADGRTARRRAVRFGRQSPTAVEVLSGLAPGDRVVTSDYDRLGDARALTLD